VKKIDYKDYASSSINELEKNPQNIILMRRTKDKIYQRISKILEETDEPLETKDIGMFLNDVSRIKILYRLNNLRGDGLIKGKPVGSGKGAWIWWRKNAFE